MLQALVDLDWVRFFLTGGPCFEPSEERTRFAILMAEAAWMEERSWHMRSEVAKDAYADMARALRLLADERGA